MKKKITIVLLFAMLFYSFNVFSQKNTKEVSVCTFKTNNHISNEFKKELEIFYTINPNADYVLLSFTANNCDDEEYGCPIIYGDEDYTIIENIKGVLTYKNKIVYLEADSNVICKFFLFFKKIKDTIINYNFYYNYSYDDTVIFDDSGDFFYWMNKLERDSILVKIPCAEPIKEYDLSEYPKKRWYPFTKKLTISPNRMKFKKEFDKPQLIYFVYEIEEGVPVYFYSFYSKDESNTDNLVDIILKNFKNSKKLKREKYLGKAYTDGKYLIIDYTYLNYIR